MSRIKVLVLCPHYAPAFKAGGVVTTLMNLVSCLEDDVSFSILTSDRDLGDNESYSNVKVDKPIKVGRNILFYSKSFLKFIFLYLKIIFSSNRFDYIYINGLFSLKYSILPGVLASLFLPKSKVIFAVRGEASDAAMSISSKKKNFFLRFLRAFPLYRKFTCQASSVYEQEDVNRNFYGIFRQVFVVQDAISKPSGNFKSKSLVSPVKILFVGRIAPIKNLDFALESLRGLPMEVDFDLYGIIEDSEYWDSCQAIISSMPLNISVKHFGPLSKNSLLRVFSDYDLLLFPSKSENFGHVIYECLSEGVPVLIGNRTPWRDLSAQGVGWDLPLANPKDFTRVMVTFFSLSDEERNSHRRRAVDYACRMYELIGRNESLKLFTW